MRQTLFDRLVAPLEVRVLRRGAGLELVGDFEQAVGAVFAAVQHDVFDALAQLRIEVVIDAELPALTMPMSMPAWIA